MMLFKKKETCKHYKTAGEKHLSNMVYVIRFTEYSERVEKTPSDFSYAVNECIECGKRAFSCIGLHIMRSDAPPMIDKFIRREISLDDLTEFFDKIGYRYEVTK